MTYPLFRVKPVCITAAFVPVLQQLSILLFLLRKIPLQGPQTDPDKWSFLLGIGFFHQVLV
jgi:hypothetical protein